MDIDAALATIRALSTPEAIDNASECADIAVLRDAYVTLAEHVAALDGWLSRGGFFPTAWRNPDPRLKELQGLAKALFPDV